MVVNRSQLSGTYVVRFNAPDIALRQEVPVPEIPPVISEDLERRVRERMRVNRTWNKSHMGKYRLSGFLRCAFCDSALSGSARNKKQCYRHHAEVEPGGRTCVKSIPGDPFEGHVLDYLYGFFNDVPSFDEAVRRSLPTETDRDELEREVSAAQDRLKSINKQIAHFVNAIAEGVNPALLIAKQDALGTEKSATEAKLEELEVRRAKMSESEFTQKDAEQLRAHIAKKLQRRNWRKMPVAEVRRFLTFLFGVDPKRAGYGIFVERENKKWLVTFRGAFEFDHYLLDGQPMEHPPQVGANGKKLARPMPRANLPEITCSCRARLRGRGESAGRRGG
jgi:hypothetical protein